MRQQVKLTALASIALVTVGVLTGPASASPAEATREGATTVASVRSKDATYATVLSGRLPASVTPDGKPGRLRGGDYSGFDPAMPHARVWIAGLDEGTWKRRSVRFIDIAGDRRKEAVVILDHTLGGVGWPNAVVVYDGNGRVLSSWDSGAAVKADARNGTSFGKARATSLDIVVRNIPRTGEPSCCGTGRATFRLSKGASGKPKWTLINRR